VLDVCRWTAPAKCPAFRAGLFLDFIIFCVAHRRERRKSLGRAVPLRFHRVLNFLGCGQRVAFGRAAVLHSPDCRGDNRNWEHLYLQ
jgi:hypothetical protein